MKRFGSIKNALIYGRILIGIVFILNVQAGIVFYFTPQDFSNAYELIGLPGNVAISGFGLLFLMWNIPYAFALWNPIKHWVSLIQAILMQLIGCLGEIAIILRIPENQYNVLRSSILRFIIFDSAGLFLLLFAFSIFKFVKKKSNL